MAGFGRYDRSRRGNHRGPDSDPGCPARPSGPVYPGGRHRRRPKSPHPATCSGTDSSTFGGPGFSFRVQCSKLSPHPCGPAETPIPSHRSGPLSPTSPVPFGPESRTTPGPSHHAPRRVNFGRIIEVPETIGPRGTDWEGSLPTVSGNRVLTWVPGGGTRPRSSLLPPDKGLVGWEEDEVE